MASRKYPRDSDEAQRDPLPVAVTGLFCVFVELFRAEGEALSVVTLDREITHLYAGLYHRLRLADGHRLAHGAAQHIVGVVIASAPPQITAL